MLSAFPVNLSGSTLPTGGITVSTDTMTMSDNLSSFFQSGTGSVSVTGDIDVLQQTLHGSFTFATSTAADNSTLVTIAASNVSSAWTGSTADLVSLTNGSGTLVITSSGFAGELGVTVTENLADLDLTGTFQLDVSNSASAVHETLTVAGNSVAIDLVAGSYVRLVGTESVLNTTVAELSGNITLETTGSGASREIVVGGTGIVAFLGATQNTATPDDDVGVELPEANLLAVIQSDGKFALDAHGEATLIGVEHVELSGTAFAQINTTGSLVNRSLTVGEQMGSLQLPAEVTQRFGGELTLFEDDFVDIVGDFAFKKLTDKLKIGISDADVFLGADFGTPDAIGMQVSGVGVGVVIDDAGGGYALSAAGDVELVGLDGLTIDGEVTVEANRTGRVVHETVALLNGETASITFDAADDVLSFAGDVTLSVPNAISVTGGMELFKDPDTQRLAMEISDLSLAITPFGTEVFRLGGSADFEINSADGLIMSSFTAEEFRVLGIPVSFSFLNEPDEIFPPDVDVPTEFPEVELAYPSDHQKVDLRLLNRRGYIDVQFLDRSGDGVDTETIEDEAAEFNFTGDGVGDVEVDEVENLGDDLFRYHLKDKDPDNDIGLFQPGEVTVEFIAGSFADRQDRQGLGKEEAFLVSDRGFLSTGVVELGPLLLEGPSFGIDGFQFNPNGPAGKPRLSVSVGMGLETASLALGTESQQSDATFFSELQGLHGSFDIGADLELVGGQYQLGGLGATGKFSITAERLALGIGEFVKAKAEGIAIQYDPNADASQEIVSIDALEVEIPKLEVVGALDPFTRDDGTEIPGLVVRGNGFHLGSAFLRKDGEVTLGSILKLKGPAAGVSDFGVTFGQGIDFDGEIFVAAASAELFPEKSFNLKIKDGSDGDDDGVRAALTFTDGVPDGFKFSADLFEFQLGSVLTLEGEDIEIDTGATGDTPVARFGAIGAQLKAGPLKIGGELREFGFLSDGTFKTYAGFGAFFSAESTSGDSFKWPSWLPIQVTELGIQWPDINAHPENFSLIVSAAVREIKGIPNVKVSGAIKGLRIEPALLLEGKFPVTAIESIGVGLEGTIFGADVKGSLIAGILRVDGNGEEISPLDLTTPVADRIFFVGVQGSIEIAKKGGFSVRFALSELGPLGVQVQGTLPEGILLEPISGLKLTGFSGGVEFFSTLPDAYYPEDLLDPEFAPALSNMGELSADEWLTSVKEQVVTQYNALKDNPVAGGFFAAFLSPMVITASAEFSLHPPKTTLRGVAEVRLSTDGKLLLTGDIILLDGLQRIPARIYADLSKVAKGQAKILLMAQDIPTGPSPIFQVIPTSAEIKGAISFRYLSADGEVIDFFDPNAEDAATMPISALLDPVETGEISQGALGERGYIDVQFTPSPDAELDEDSIFDNGIELKLELPDGTLLNLPGVPVKPEGAAVGVYRYELPENITIARGNYTLQVLEESWKDSLQAKNAAYSATFTVVGAGAELAAPEDGGRIDRAVLNEAGRIGLRFLPTPGARVDESTITDSIPEFVLVGAAAAGVVLGSSTRDENDENLYYYSFTGSFGTGAVEVQIVDDAFRDTKDNANTAETQSFVVTGPEADLLTPQNGASIDVLELNQLGYVEVRFVPSDDSAIDVASLTDAAAEFTLTGSAVDDVQVSGVAVPVEGESNVYRYAFTGSFAGGDVAVEFVMGAWTDAAGVSSVAETEGFKVLGVRADLVGITLFGATGLTPLNQRGYLDVRLTPTAGATLDESTILDAAAEFTLTGEAAAAITLSGEPTALGNGVYRYAFTGLFALGEVEVAFVAGEVSDSAGFQTTADTGTFVTEAPAAHLLAPGIEERADRSTLNSNGYIDIEFADLTGRGLDSASITDTAREFELLVKDDAGNWVAPLATFNGAALPLEGNTYRYFFSDAFNPGVVRVLFTEGSFSDIDGAGNLASEEQFAVINNAPGFEFQIVGSYLQRHGFKDGVFGDLTNPEHVKDLLKMFGATDSAGLQDIISKVDTGLSIVQKLITEPMLTLDGYLRFGSEILVDGSGVAVGARSTLDVSGTVGVYLLGKIGAAAGRVVVQADQNGINLWGVMELQAKLNVLRKAGIDLQAFGTFQFNTSGEDQIESLTLRGFNDDGSDLTQTYQLPAYSLQVAAAGKLIFNVPTFNDEQPFGQELFRISAVASLTISADGLQMFAKGDLEFGPPDVRLLDIDALGVFVINDKGVAGDMQIDVKAGDIAAIKDYFQFDVSARVVFNTTGEDQQVKILDRFLPFLTEDFKTLLVDCEDAPPPSVSNTFANTATKCYVVGAAPPPRPNGTQGPVSMYVVLAAQGNLNIAQVFRLHGDFYFELNSSPELFVTLNASIALDPIAAAAISGTFHIDKHGAYGGLQIGASLDVGPLHLFGAAQFEFNTQSFDASIDRYVFDFNQERVTDQRETVILKPGSFHIIVAGVASITDSFKFRGYFELENKPDVIAVSLDASFNAFDALRLHAFGNFNIVKGPKPGLVMNVGATLEAGFLGFDGVFDMEATFQLLVNTRGNGPMDQYDLGVQRGLTRIAVSGELALFGALTMQGSGFIEVNNGVFRMQVNMSTSFFGLANLSASGYFSSEGEVDLSLGGSFTFGVPGFLGVSAGGSIRVSLLDDNGTEAFGDGNTQLSINGSLQGTFWVFGFTVGASLTVNYSTGTGLLSVTPCFKIEFLFFSIEICATFNIGVLKADPPIFPAGNEDDAFGQKFRGGVLYLNMGPRTFLRNYDTDDDHTNEHFEVLYVGPDTDNGGHIVRVAGNNLKRTYRGVTAVVGDGGSGRDFLETEAGLPIPVTLSGGSQRDRILHLGSGPAVIDGGLGDDELFGGTGDDVFLFSEGDGVDVVEDLGGTATLDFDGVYSNLSGVIQSNSLAISSAALLKQNSARAFVRLPEDGDELTGPQFAPVALEHDGDSRLLVSHPDHPFHEGAEIEIASPDVGLNSTLFARPKWRITEVTADSYVIEIAADEIGRGSSAKAVWRDGDGNNVQREVTVLHDGEHTATVYDPNHGVRVGQKVVIDSEDSTAYTDEFVVTAVTENSYSFNLDFVHIRDTVTTNFEVDALRLGRGDDILTTTGFIAASTSVTDAGGLDEVFVDGGLPSTVTLTTGSFNANNLHLGLGTGVERLTLFTPTQSLTLNGTGGHADLGEVGLRVVADSVNFNTALDAGHIVVDSKQTIDVDQPLNATHDGYIDLRAFGDGTNVLVNSTLTVSTGDSQDGLGAGLIRLEAPDGSISGLSFNAPNSHLIYKAKNAPTGPLQTHLAALTFASAAHGTTSDLSIVEQDGLILTSLDHYDVPFQASVFGDDTFSGITWVTTATTDWLDQVRDGNDLYALVVPDGTLSITLLAEDSLLYLDAGQLITQGAGKDITITADDITFRSGPSQVIGTGKLRIKAQQAVWNYRLGTAGENAAGSDLARDAFAQSMDFSSRDLAALADGFTQITIGRSDTGNTMIIGDAFDSHVIKFTGQLRDRDARFRDPTTLLTDSLIVAGDAQATGKLDISAPGGVAIQGPNLHVPNGGIDSGLTALELIIDIGHDLLVSGWLIAAAILEVTVTGDVTIDVGALIETRDDNNTLLIDASGAMSVAGKVESKGAGGKPQLKAGGTFSLSEGGSVSAPGENALVKIESAELVTLDEGTAVLAGVQFDSSSGSPIAMVTGANSNVEIRSPHELFIPSSIAASNNITLIGGEAAFDHSDYFQSAVPADHPLHGRSQFAILVTGTLLTFGNAADLMLTAADDVIVRGNIDIRGSGSNLVLQSDKSVFFEGFTTLASGNVTLSGGVELDGTDRGGADATGSSVTVYKTSRIETQNAGSTIDIRGSRDVDLLGAIIAGGVVGSSGVAWTAPGDATITVRAGEQIFVDNALQASRSVTLTGGTPGADDGGLSVVMTPASGINAAGFSADAAARGLVQITATGDLELMGHITSGATIVESASGTTYDWTGHRDSDVLISATGRAFIGGNTVNIDGDPITVGGVICASRLIDIDGRLHSSGAAVLIHPNSELSTHNADGSIVITSDQDAVVRGRIASGGEIVDGVVTLFDGTATLNITAAQQVLISREIAAAKTISVVGGTDPVNPDDSTTGLSVAVAATGLLRTSSANGLVDVSGPGDIKFFNVLDESAYNVQSPGLDSAIHITAGDQLTMGGRLQSYRDIVLNNSTLPQFAASVELTETSLLETINGSITFNAGATGAVRGDLTAGGEGSDITILFTSDNLVISGDLQAADEILLDVAGVLDVSGDLTANRLSLTAGTATVVGQTDLFIRDTATLAGAGTDATISLIAQNNLLIEGTVGRGTRQSSDGSLTTSATSTVTIESLAGNITLTAESGRIESGAELLVKGRNLDLFGVVRTSGSSASVGEYDVTFDASTVLTVTGDVDVAGSLLAKAPQSVAISRGTLRVSGEKLLRIESPEVVVGAVGTESQPTELGGVIASAGQLEIVATDVVLRAGTHVLATGNDGSIRIDADYLDVVGSIRAGADITDSGAVVWTGTSADVDLNIREMLTLGGQGFDASGTLADAGGRIQATGTIDIAVNGGTDAVGFHVANQLSTVQTDATGFGALTATAASSIIIATDRSLHFAGTMFATDDGADITLSAGKLLKLDGFAQADDQLTATGGTDSSGLTIHVTGTLTTAGGGHIALSGPGQILNEGVIGQLRPDGDTTVVDTGRVTITTPGAFDGRGTVMAQSLIEIDAAQINVLNGGLIRATRSDALIDARATGNALIARGGQILSSGSIQLLGQNIRVDGFVDNDNGSAAPRVLANAVESIVVTGAMTSRGDLHLNAGVGASWTDEQLTGAISADDLTDGLVRVEGAGKLFAVGTLKATSGGDVELQADAEAPGAQRSVQTPTIVFSPQTIDVVVGYREIAGGVIFTPVVTWVDTLVEIQTGVELVRNGTYFHTMDVTLAQDGYYNGTTQREYFIQGVDYANNLADVTVNAFGLTLAANNSGQPNWVFRGSPDDVGFALSSTNSVTYNFSDTPITNQTGGDFNVYEVVGGDGAEFNKIKVEVSADGITFLDVTASAASSMSVAGDEGHDDAFARSYDILSTGLSAVKFVRVAGTAANGLELDAVGALIVNPNQAPVIDWQGDAPGAGATFNQLSQAQREIVRITLGYQPLYDFSFANAKEHRTQNGSTSVVDWMPYWATAARHIVQFAIPGLEDRYIRVPIDAELDVARAVTQGSPTTFTETVGSFTDSAVARYDQDRSRYTGADDLDQSIERFAVSYVHGGRQTFTLNDGFGGTLVATPAWGTSVDTEVGGDVNSRLVLAPLGYLADTKMLVGSQLLQSHPDVRILNPAFHPMLNDNPQPSTILLYISGSFNWFSAVTDASVRGGYLAGISSAREAFWARTLAQGNGAWIGNNDIAQEGVFRGVTGEVIPYSNFASGEPNNQGDEDVVEMYPDGTWNDLHFGSRNFGYILERPAVETFNDYQFDWTSKTHSVQDTRLTLSFEWASSAHDLYTEVPVFELQNAKLPVTEQVATTGWVSVPITEPQTVLKPTRVLVAGPAAEFAVFSGDSLKSESSIVIDAARDVSLSGLVTSKNEAGTAGSITIDAGRDFLMSGAKPDGAAESMQAAVAGMTAVSSIEITTGGDFTLAESINITADDGNAVESMANAIIVTTTGDAIIRGTLSTTNTKIGEITVNAGDEIELKGEIVSGHVVNVFAGTDGIGGITSDIQGHIRTLGSEVHFGAGANGGNITLTDLFLETNGSLTIIAPSGAITHTGGLLTAGALTVNALNGISLTVEADSLNAEVTGSGGITVNGFGAISLDRLITADGTIEVQSTGNINVGNVTAGGTNGGVNITPLGNATLSGNVSFSDPLFINVLGGESVTTSVAELHLNVITPGNVTVTHLGSGTLTLFANVLNGSLTVNTAGDLIVPELHLLSNMKGNALTLDAGGNVTIGLIDAGDYSATDTAAAGLRTARGMAANDFFTSLTDVTIRAGGFIQEVATADPDVDVIAGSLTLLAGTGISGLELAINQLTEAKTTTGSITLTDTEGVGERSLGLDVIKATATAGGVSITAGGSMLTGAVTAGGTGQAVSLTAQTGSLSVQAHGAVAPGLSSAGGVQLNAHDDVLLDGGITAANAVTIVAGTSLLTNLTNFTLSAGGALSIDAQAEISLGGNVAARGSVSIVSHNGNIVLPANVQAQNGGTLSEIVVNAHDNLNLAGGTLGSVKTRLSLQAGKELLTGLEQIPWVVTGANGELIVSAGGDLVLLGGTVLKADRISVTSTGYQDSDNHAVGGHLTMIATPQGATASAPQRVALSATNDLYLQQGITAADTLRIDKGQVVLSRTGHLRLHENEFLADGIDAATSQAFIQGSIGSLAATKLELAAGTTVLVEQTPTTSDQLRGTSQIVLVGGTITLEIIADAEAEPSNVAPLIGTIAGAGGLTVEGQALLVFDASHTYSGATTIEGGTLLVPGNTATGRTVLINGGTLTGSGTIQGSVTIGEGGHLVPGMGTVLGNLTTGSITFLDGSFFDLDFTPTAHEQIFVIGTVTIGQNATVAATAYDGFKLKDNVTYTIIDNDGSSDGYDSFFDVLTFQDPEGNEQPSALLYNGDDGNNVVAISALEFGDAPAPYPTKLVNNGARHSPVGATLGPKRDAESNGVPSDTATGDDSADLDDEDGITFRSTIVADGSVATRASIEVDLQSADPEGNFLNGWLDLNHDGDWSDPGEHIISSVSLGTTNGKTIVTFTIPVDTGDNVVTERGPTFARFRLSTVENLAPNGIAPNGEVEDYAVEIVQSGDVTEAVVNRPTSGEGEMVVEVVNGSIVVRRGDEVLLDTPVSELKTVVINGTAAANDTLALDFTNGNPIPVGGLFFNGGTGGEDIITVAGGLVRTATYTFESRTDGQIHYLIGNQTFMIDYTGLEPITDNMQAENRIFDFTGGAESIELLDTNGDDGMMTISSTSGESVEFINPTVSLTINGGSGSDTITIASLDTLLTVRPNIDGGAGDDTIVLGNGVIVGQITGGADTDLLDYSAFTTAVTVELTAGTATNTSSIANIENVTGGNGDDRLIGNSGNNVLTGNGGNDTLTGLAGTDQLFGGLGTDRVVESVFGILSLTTSLLTGKVGGGTDSLNSIDEASLTGSSGNDSINASTFTGPVTLRGGAGNDSLLGGTGSDVLDGGEGKDTLKGGLGDDTLTGDAGIDSLDGGSGTDWLRETVSFNVTITNSKIVGFGKDQFVSIECFDLTGDAHDNLFDASQYTLGSVILHGNGGNDTLLGGSRNDTIDGGIGNDLVTGNDGSDQIDGGLGTDLLRQASAQNQTVSNTQYQGLGTDSLASIEQMQLSATGRVGVKLDALAASISVTLSGGDGGDTLTGGSGSNVLNGNAGNDKLTGGKTSDILNGGVGNDSLEGNAGTDQLNGQSGNDTLRGNAGDDRMFGEAGNDKLFGGDGQDLMDGGDGNDTLTGEVGHDTINGGAGNDAISGGSSDDLINGGAGNDTILGGIGDDTLRSGGGKDYLSGGSGNDRFEATGARVILGGGDDKVVGLNNKIDAVFIFDFEKLLV